MPVAHDGESLERMQLSDHQRTAVRPVSWCWSEAAAGAQRLEARCLWMEETGREAPPPVSRAEHGYPQTARLNGVAEG